MFQNPDEERQITSDYQNPNLQALIDNNELDANPVSKRLYRIADELAEARAYRLDSKFFTHELDKKRFITSVSKKIFGRDLPKFRLEPITEESLKREESKIGADLFGERKPGEQIAFFNDNRESWFFYQSITDKNGVSHSTTFHYEVRPEGVVRVVTDDSGMKCAFVQGQELDNLITATEAYHDRVMEQIYNLDSSTDKIAA